MVIEFIMRIQLSDGSKRYSRKRRQALICEGFYTELLVLSFRGYHRVYIRGGYSIWLLFDSCGTQDV